MTNGLMTAGRIPRRVSVNPNRVPLSAMTMSATAHRPIPPPSAAPWTRAMTGAGQASIASNISAIAIASASFASRSRAIEARIQAMSAPAQKLGPAPPMHDRPELDRGLLREPDEGRPELGDEGGVEGVVDGRSIERHPSDDIARTGPFDAQPFAHPPIVGW